MDIIKHLNWRYAIKRFNPEKKVSSEHISYLQESIRLTPTSYGLQPFHVYVIENRSQKKQLFLSSFGQNQIIDASHLFVFCNQTHINENDIDQYINKTLIANAENHNSLREYGTTIKNHLLNLDSKEVNQYTSNQTYIALGTFLTACASLNIDACPMEGFNHQEYNTILNLNEKHLNASVVVAIGYRSTDDFSQYRSKIRKTTEELISCI